MVITRKPGNSFQNLCVKSSKSNAGLFVFKIYVIICVYVWCTLVPATGMSVPAYKGQKKASDPLEMALQAIVSHLTWELGTEFQSSTRATSALIH